MLTDQTQRQLATDPGLSFIVQAPAGSGKTEILTQRYLRLLSTVKAPEQIIAITFTRKAANEMRERIVQSLQKAADGMKPVTEHQRQTFEFASAALEKNLAEQWRLLEQPNRLRIFTIDSLCQNLSHSIPLLEKQIPYAEIADKPQQHYLNAARACLEFAMHHETYQQPLKTLLYHVDNKQEKLLDLFSDLLANREQWLSLLHAARTQDQSRFEDAIRLIEQHELVRFREAVPEEYRTELTTIARKLGLIQATMDSPRYPLSNWTEFNQVDRTLSAALAAAVLTSQDGLRKSFDHHVGLKRGDCSDEDYNDLKAASSHLLAKLDKYPGFLEALIRVKNLPPPEYDPEQWQVLQALFALLPLLAAHLHVIFSEHNEVDFSAIAEFALQSLGDDEEPTDLALYLDHQIQHLLVDEFQDTSIQQFQLLTQLVQGWQTNDGKTLFVVGDPMQSIYRFRAAEVGLFLRAKHQGIGPVALNPLALDCNFRSTDTIVHWVNQQFQTIFPPRDDIESGAVAFHQSIHTKPSTDASFVKAFQFTDSVQAAIAMVNLARETLDTYPDDDIAILVRSRSHLSDIITLLRAQQIPFQGVDIDLLSALPHLRDVWTLTQALLMPANRLHWLALLRSPWCGLELSDLHCIANFDRKKSIYWALSQLDNLTGLTAEGRQRAHFIYQILNYALNTRHQQSLTEWISETLKLLHLDKILNSSEQEDLEQYWLLIQQFEQDGQIADLKQFKTELNKLYSKKAAPSRLQIMTIHKSKGLEFDSVILPGLGARPPAKDTPMLRWLKLPSETDDLLLVSPIKAAHQQSCLLYDYLGRLDAQKNDYEIQRLLYVAATRAKKRLYLFDDHEKGSQGTFRELLKNQEFTIKHALPPREVSAPTLPTRSILPIHFYQELPALPMNFNGGFTAELKNQSARLIGIVAHELLEWICNHHPHSLTDIPWQLAIQSLQNAGFFGDELSKAIELLNRQFLQLFSDEKGLWIIQKHQDEKNEYELLIEESGVIETRIIDRTFRESSWRYIIDFKTGREDEASQATHRKQVNGYAALLHAQHAEPIRCGLYYLTNQRFVEWEYMNEQ